MFQFNGGQFIGIEFNNNFRSSQISVDKDGNIVQKKDDIVLNILLNVDNRIVKIPVYYPKAIMEFDCFDCDDAGEVKEV